MLIVPISLSLLKNNDWIMNECVIAYASQFGSTLRHTKESGERKGWDVVGYNCVKDSDYIRKIVYFSGLFARDVHELKRTFSQVTAFKGKRIAVVTGSNTLRSSATFSMGLSHAHIARSVICPSFFTLSVEDF